MGFTQEMINRINSDMEAAREANKALSGDNIDIIYSRLRELSKQGSISYSLRRFVHDLPGVIDKGDTFSLHFSNERGEEKDYCFARIPDLSKEPIDTMSAEEVGRYADVLFSITRANKCDKTRMNTLLTWGAEPLPLGPKLRKKYEELVDREKTGELAAKEQEELKRLRLIDKAFQEYSDMTSRDRIRFRLGASATMTNPGNEDAITKQEYKNFLGDSNPGREKLFVISLALGMNGDQYRSMCSAAGEAPCYNFHSPSEIILYICHHAHNERYRSLDGAMDLMSRYKEMLGELPEKAVSVSEATSAELSRVFRGGLQEYLSGTQDKPENEAIDRILQYLVENSDFIASCSSSRSAKTKFIDLYSQVNEQLKTAVYEEEEQTEIKPQTEKRRMWKNIVGSITTEWFSLSDDEDLDDFDLKNDEVTRTDAPIQGIQGRRLNTARIHNILAGITPVQKSDIVYLCLLNKLDIAEEKRVDQLDLGDYYMRLQKFRDFWRSTDRILDELGMPRLYALNFFDNAVLSCFASKKPGDFFLDYFFGALE